MQGEREAAGACEAACHLGIDRVVASGGKTEFT
jgi:hypothetical protein